MTDNVLKNAYFGSGLYDLALGKKPAQLERVPVDAWLGEPLRANAMFQGRYVAAGQEIVSPNQAPWALEAGPSWHAYFHSFVWLRDFRAVGGTVARQRARELVQSWLTANRRWSPLAWRPDILGRRLAAWIHHSDFILNGARPDLAETFRVSLGRQVAHLRRVAHSGPAGYDRIAPLIGLNIAAIALGGAERWRAQVQKTLEQEIAHQILADGGHIERNPAAHFHVLRDFVGFRLALVEARLDPPPALVAAIDRMTPMLRLFRHGDGALALFNGGTEESAGHVDATLARADVRSRPPASAHASGFERLAAGRTIVVVDVGGPPAAPFDARIHAGCLSFEMSVGSDRLIVNCGATPAVESIWHEPLRATAAHSTVVIADTNALDIRPGGLRRRPHAIAAGRRDADDGTQALDARHDGYAGMFGIDHHRRLTLHRSGDRLAGEDRLVPSGAQKHTAVPFAVRFHLHPDVRASLQQDRRAVILRLARGSGWIFESEASNIALEESIYLGTGRPRRTSQIVVTGASTALTTLNWSLARVGD